MDWLVGPGTVIGAVVAAVVCAWLEVFFPPVYSDRYKRMKRRQK